MTIKPENLNKTKLINTEIPNNFTIKLKFKNLLNDHLNLSIHPVNLTFALNKQNVIDANHNQFDKRNNSKNETNLEKFCINKNFSENIEYLNKNLIKQNGSHDDVEIIKKETKGNIQSRLKRNKKDVVFNKNLKGNLNYNYGNGKLF